MNKIIYFDIQAEIDRCVYNAKIRAGVEYDDYHRNRRKNFVLFVIEFLEVVSCFLIAWFIPMETWKAVLLAFLTIILVYEFSKSLLAFVRPPKLAVLTKAAYKVPREDFIDSYFQSLFTINEQEYLIFLSLFKKGDIREISALLHESGNYVLNYSYVGKHDERRNVTEIKSWNLDKSLVIIFIDEVDVRLDIPTRTLYIPDMYKDYHKLQKISFDLEMVNIIKGD